MEEKENVFIFVLWIEEEIEEMKKLFKIELEMGVIEEWVVREKLIGVNFFMIYIVKVVVIKLWWLREEFM